ncbi:MAG: putative nickel/cobalt efflux system RcnA [Parcubacteria group bacterium Gr01-1014_31]|nr:MAG: putative nickel/cobalt efflux system RcnA [Parcubacteria group bacterium Gr01-1014_31]
MSTWWSIYLLGLVLGVKHALDADHVLAVTAMAAETKSVRRSWQLGLRWGLGHTLALMTVGILLLAFRVTMPVVLALLFEYAVAAMLVWLGVNVLRTMRRERLHVHAHVHDHGVRHVHWHAHAGSPAHAHQHRSFLVGMLHGLAGSAALALLVMASAPTFGQGMLFAGVFGAGSILGMMAVSSALTVPFLLTQRFDRAHRAVQLSAGCLSIVMGGLLAAELTAKLLPFAF